MQLGNKGSLADLSLGVVMTIVSLFVGLYMITQVVAVFPEKSFQDYTYNTTTDGTDNLVNSTNYASYTGFNLYSVRADEYIEGENTNNQLTIAITHTGASATLNATLNGVSLGTWTPTWNTTSTKTFNDVTYVNKTQNNVTVGSTGAAAEATVTGVSTIFAEGKAANTLGGVQAGITSSSGTIFDVMILVIIVVALGVAIAVLRGFGGRDEYSGSPI